MENDLSHKILVISNKPPYPIIDGGCYAMSKFEKLLQHAFGSIYYFAISTPKHPFDEKNLPDYWKLNENFFTGKIDTKIKNKDVVKYLAGSSIRASRFYDAEVEHEILRLIQEKNIRLVVFESIYAAVYMKSIRKLGNVKLIIRAHNIEHEIWQKYYANLPKGLKKLAFKSETTRLEHFEEECLNGSDANIFISDQDLEFYKRHVSKENAIAIPVQMEIQPVLPTLRKKGLKLFHIGAMDWMPNIQGIENFIRHIFPVILQAFPETELHIAGKAMPEAFYKYASTNIFVHGQVEDANTFIANFDALIVPIETGSGIRIKVLEAMAAGKPVISTAQGIEGIPAIANKEFMLATDTELWIKSVGYLSDPTQYDNIAKAAHQFIERSYSEQALINRLAPFIQKYS